MFGTTTKKNALQCRGALIGILQNILFNDISNESFISQKLFNSKISIDNIREVAGEDRLNILKNNIVFQSFA